VVGGNPSNGPAPKGECVTRILGIDPGLRRCGWGIVDARVGRVGYVACGVIAPPTDRPLSDRLAVLFEEMVAVVMQYAPESAAIENTFVNANPASALKLGHARAAAMLAPAQRGLSVAEYAPRLIKQAVTGTGGAPKDQVATMVRMLLPGSNAKDDAADALAVAVCHAHLAGTQERMARQVAQR